MPLPNLHIADICKLDKGIKDAVQSVCKQRLCLHFGIQNIEFYSTTIYIKRQQSSFART
jgi:hypothetical protein